ncbi:MAG TPA: hypothetical protein VMZ28_09915 [Kofleriaceae bacterium]|nr:hypothetical protein [Kofleriaceae bacterium]
MTKFLFLATLIFSTASSANAFAGTRYKGMRRSDLHLPPTERYTAHISPSGRFSSTNALRTRKLRWKDTRRGRKSVDTSLVVPFVPDVQVKVGQAWVGIQWQGDALSHGESPRLEMLHRPGGILQGEDVYTLSKPRSAQSPTRNEVRFFLANPPDHTVAGPNGMELHFYLNGSSGIPLKVFMTDGVTMEGGRLAPVKLMNILDVATLAPKPATP